MVDSTPEEPILEDQNETVEPERPVDPPKNYNYQEETSLAPEHFAGS
jgi:hypothetical protein